MERWRITEDGFEGRCPIRFGLVVTRSYDEPRMRALEKEIEAKVQAYAEKAGMGRGGEFSFSFPDGSARARSSALSLGPWRFREGLQTWIEQLRGSRGRGGGAVSVSRHLRVPLPPIFCGDQASFCCWLRSVALNGRHA